jgi:hypothetical protein
VGTAATPVPLLGGFVARLAQDALNPKTGWVWNPNARTWDTFYQELVMGLGQLAIQNSFKQGSEDPVDEKADLAAQVPRLTSSHALAQLDQQTGSGKYDFEASDVEASDLEIHESFFSEYRQLIRMTLPPNTDLWASLTQSNGRGTVTPPPPPASMVASPSDYSFFAAGIVYQLGKQPAPTPPKPPLVRSPPPPPSPSGYSTDNSDEWVWPWDKDATFFGERVRDLWDVEIGLGQAVDELNPMSPSMFAKTFNMVSQAPAMLDRVEQVGKAIRTILGEDEIPIRTCTICAFDRERLQYQAQRQWENFSRALDVLNTNLNPYYAIRYAYNAGKEAYNRGDPIEAGRLWGRGATTAVTTAMAAYGAVRGLASGLVGRTTLSGFSEITTPANTAEVENAISTNDLGGAVVSKAEQSAPRIEPASRPTIPVAQIGRGGTITSNPVFRRFVRREAILNPRELGYLLDSPGPRGRLFRSPPGSTMWDWFHEPRLVEAGHVGGSAKSLAGTPAHLAVTSKYYNRLFSATIEHPSIGGWMRYSGETILVKTVPFDMQTAYDLVMQGKMPADVFESAPLILY